MVNFVPPCTRTVLAENNLINRSYKYWQLLPNKVRSKPTLMTVKTAMKSGDYFEHMRWAMTCCLFSSVLDICILYNEYCLLNV